ncbi:MAG: hypothetical protein L0338_11500 [Acidobacteria bacterium]|nr:hypothetical protein [Acidobacteriota bacterium]
MFRPSYYIREQKANTLQRDVLSLPGWLLCLGKVAVPRPGSLNPIATQRFFPRGIIASAGGIPQHYAGVCFSTRSGCGGPLLGGRGRMLRRDGGEDAIRGLLDAVEALGEKLGVPLVKLDVILRGGSS